MAGLRLIAVNIGLLPRYWEEAWDLLEPAAARNGLYTKGSVFAALCKGDFQLWVAEDEVVRIAAITEIAAYPGLNIGAVVLLGGDGLDAALPFLDHIEAWARANGCNRFINEGRGGFARKLKSRGYRMESIRMVKDFLDA